MMQYPYDFDHMLRKQKSLRRELLAADDAQRIEKRIAILGGSTTSVIRDMLELFLLDAGIRPVFYESEYDKYYEDAVFGNEVLDAFHPDIVLVLTSVVNLIERPALGDDAATVQEKLAREMVRYTAIWDALRARYQVSVIQTTFDVPEEAPLGSLGAVLPCGMERYVAALNERFAVAAMERPDLYLCDLHGLSARIGGQKWHDRAQYAAYKFAMSYDVMPQVALALANILRSMFGKMKKCLVLDLDNTLWGGVIGDDGLDGIAIGHETAAAEAFTTFQRYVKALRERGVLLAVCSKNDEDVAKSGFSHPDSVLAVSDFVAFRANWLPKNENIRAIAEEINIGTDSLVFLDDNPAERAIVRETMPEVAVPEVTGGDVFSYIRAIEEAGYFEPVAISDDDRKRNETYRENRERRELQQSLGSYDDFLASLQMKAVIAPFRSIYFDRIAQLTNKSNQFNLTTRRYTRADIARMADDPACVTLYGRLADRFGDNGLISVVIGKKEGAALRIDLWLMSCRVLKRGMEQAMLDVLVQRATATGCTELLGEYLPTKKNKMVAGLYESFGFTKVREDADGRTVWRLELKGYVPQARFIEVEGA
ncbi:HAD family hydrolase [uncultured Selenomonas sp.]|uniref:HAD-IIIC family phosphatase n=1 Tax=uncultured Selenomonas sp. TaxID=159275 RepID=UPI0025D8C1A5|nr:HAD-IIIC family phosphatase [uncultured Selenomonas sp.]